MRRAPLLVAVALLAACGGGTRDTVTVPDVRGADLETTQRILLEAGVVHEAVKCDVPADYAVIDQRPRPGDEVEPGTRVALLLEQQHGSGVAPPAGGWPSCETAGFK